MIKFNDVSQMIHKKISRNNVICEIFQLSKDMNDIQIQIKEYQKTSYDEKIKLLLAVNDIELLQSTEYTIERQQQISNLMDQVKCNPNIDIFLSNIKTIQTIINEKTIISTQYQNLIPKNGIVTNYKLITTDKYETCSKAVKY